MATQAFTSRMRPRDMFKKIIATKAANELALRTEAAHRESDPFELAKSYLQRRGFHVFAHSVIRPNSDLICVGHARLTREEVIAKAERMRR